MRPPRFFRDLNIPLQPYSEEENIGQGKLHHNIDTVKFTDSSHTCSMSFCLFVLVKLELLSRINKGIYRAEGYRWHSELPSGDISLVTSCSVLVVGDVTDYCEIRWECLIQLILFIEVEYPPSLPLPTSSECVRQGLNQKSKDNKGKKSKRARAPHEKVTLHIYYLPDLRRGKKQLSLRFLHKELDLTDHEAALEFLSHMIRRQPKLQTDLLEEYFDKCGATLPYDHQTTQMRASSSNITLCSTHTSQGPSGHLSGQRTPRASTPGTNLPSSGGSGEFMKFNSVFNRNINGGITPGVATTAGQQKPNSTPASLKSSDPSYTHQYQQPQQRPPRSNVPGMGANGLAPIIIPKLTSPDSTLSPSTKLISSPITPMSVPHSPHSASDNPFIISGGVSSAFTSHHSSRNKFDLGSPTTSDISTTAEKGDAVVRSFAISSKLSPTDDEITARISPSNVSPRYTTRSPRGLLPTPGTSLSLFDDLELNAYNNVSTSNSDIERLQTVTEDKDSEQI